jgi:hypothetical protein
MFSFLSSTPPNTQTHKREKTELGRDLNNQKHKERKIDPSCTNQEGEGMNFFLWLNKNNKTKKRRVKRTHQLLTREREKELLLL